MSPCIKLENRKPDTTAVMTQDMAELVNFTQ
jgi:hypothetical protein